MQCNFFHIIYDILIESKKDNNYCDKAIDCIFSGNRVDKKENKNKKRKEKKKQKTQFGVVSLKLTPKLTHQRQEPYMHPVSSYHLTAVKTRNKYQL